MHLQLTRALLSPTFRLTLTIPRSYSAKRRRALPRRHFTPVLYVRGRAIRVDHHRPKLIQANLFAKLNLPHGHSIVCAVVARRQLFWLIARALITSVAFRDDEARQRKDARDEEYANTQTRAAATHIAMATHIATRVKT